MIQDPSVEITRPITWHRVAQPLPPPKLYHWWIDGEYGAKNAGLITVKLDNEGCLEFTFMGAPKPIKLGTQQTTQFFNMLPFVEAESKNIRRV